MPRLSRQPWTMSVGVLVDCCVLNEDLVRVDQQKNRPEAGDNGEGGIRTLDRVAPIQHFQCCAFDHSATSPVEVLSKCQSSSMPSPIKRS
jgi:hypothetical protein